jgi:hypothetical protein
MNGSLIFSSIDVNTSYFTTSLPTVPVTTITRIFLFPVLFMNILSFPFNSLNRMHKCRNSGGGEITIRVVS